MEYGAFDFSRYGVSPVLETMPAGMVLGIDLPQYTSGDLDGIERLYGFVPSKITVDSNPTGLQLVVDSVTCTAPCVFSNWTLGSQHTLAVSQTIQTLGTAPGQQSYLFGRWNSDVSNTQSATVTVTNSAGSGTLLSPATSPAITNYLASFIPLHPYNPLIQANNGNTGSTVATIAVNPTPYNGILNGVSTNYFKDRQQIALTVTAKNGYTFHHWAYVSLPTLYSYFLNFNIISNLDFDDMGNQVTAAFVNDAVTSVTGESSDPDIVFGISPGFSFGVVEDSNQNATLTAYTPRNFDAFYDGTGFAAGKQLTFCGSGLSGTTCPATPVPQSPVTTNMTYLNYGWSGSSTNALTVTIPSFGAQQTLYLSYTFREIILPSVSSQFCPGVQVSTVPAGTNNQGTDGGLDAFYAPGLQAISAAGDPGVVNFVIWSGDLGGSGSPYDQTLNTQTIATANYNVPGTTSNFPFAVTSISPATPAATNSATGLTVTGTGFLQGNTAAYFDIGSGNFAPRTTTVQSPTQLTMQLQAGDLASVGYSQILLVNTGASTCNPQALFTFPVASSTGAPALSITKMHNGVFGPGEQNAQYTILVTNSGTASISAPVTVTEAVPSGESLVSMSGGSAWNCSAPPRCTTSNTLAAGLSYPAITVTVNVAANAASPQINSATVSGGGSQPATATDSTEIVATVQTPNVTNDTQAAAESAITNAGLTVGQVTTAASNTVPAGSVISTDPSGGTAVAPGTAVNIVVAAGAGLGPCDINLDGTYDVPDAQKMINQTLGTSPPANDLNGDRVVNVVDIQIVINAVLGRGCTV
jgi:hypothetical protein